MIAVTNLSKTYPTRQGPVTVLKDINFTVKHGEKVAILGRNGAGKSTLVRLVSGAEWPSGGEIQRGMRVSWPLAFGGAFQSTLTGFDNLRFICRIHGIAWQPCVPFVEEFSELGHYLREPLRSYSSGMRARLAFAISMVVEFDCFLIDEIVAVGDARFHEKCHTELFEKRADRAMIIVSHDAPYIRDHCSKVGVLHGGHLKMFSNVDEGYSYYSDVYHVN
jgi:capsular polysaccharide transport system ATP-binding protein